MCMCWYTYAWLHEDVLIYLYRIQTETLKRIAEKNGS